MKTKSKQSMSDTLKQLHKSLTAKRNRLKQQVEDCEEAMKETAEAFRLLSPYKVGDVLRVIFECNKELNKVQRGKTVKVAHVHAFEESYYKHELPNAPDYTYSLEDEETRTISPDTSWNIIEAIKLPL